VLSCFFSRGVEAFRLPCDDDAGVEVIASSKSASASGSLADHDISSDKASCEGVSCEGVSCKGVDGSGGANESIVLTTVLFGRVPKISSSLQKYGHFLFKIAKQLVLITRIQIGRVLNQL